MITLHTRTSRGCITHHVQPQAIARITETGPSSQWHGIRAIVKLFDGDILEVEETADSVRALVDKAREGSTP